LEHTICVERKKYKSAYATNVTLSAAQKQSDAALDGIMHYVATVLAKTTTRSSEGVKELVMATLRAAQAPEADIQRVMERLQSSGRMDEEVQLQLQAAYGIWLQNQLDTKPDSIVVDLYSLQVFFRESPQIFETLHQELIFNSASAYNDLKLQQDFDQLPVHTVLVNDLVEPYMLWAKKNGRCKPDLKLIQAKIRKSFVQKIRKEHAAWNNEKLISFAYNSLNPDQPLGVSSRVRYGGECAIPGERNQSFIYVVFQRKSEEEV